MVGGADVTIHYTCVACVYGQSVYTCVACAAQVQVTKYLRPGMPLEKAEQLRKEQARKAAQSTIRWKPATGAVAPAIFNMQARHVDPKDSSEAADQVEEPLAEDPYLDPEPVATDPYSIVDYQNDADICDDLCCDDDEDAEIQELLMNVSCLLSVIFLQVL